MKKALFASLLLMAATALTATAETPMMRQTRFAGQHITGVAASRGFKVEIYQSANTSATIEIPVELKDEVVVSLSAEGVVTLGFKNGNPNWGHFKKTASAKTEGKNSSDPEHDKKVLADLLHDFADYLGDPKYSYTAKIYIRNLGSLKVSSGAAINAMTPFSGTSVRIDLDGGRIENLHLTTTGEVLITSDSGGSLHQATINAPSLAYTLDSGSQTSLAYTGAKAHFDLDSGAQATVSGRSEEALVVTDSGSSFKGEAYDIGRATLESDSGSRITVGTVKTLSAAAESGSSIRYKGTPKITRHDTSSGGSLKSIP